jgi:hypothetical protein
VFLARKFVVWVDGMVEISQLATLTGMFSVFMVCEMTFDHKDDHKLSV